MVKVSNGGEKMIKFIVSEHQTHTIKSFKNILCNHFCNVEVLIPAYKIYYFSKKGG